MVNESVSAESTSDGAAPVVIDLEPGDPEAGGLQLRLPLSAIAEVKALLAEFDVEYRETIGKSVGADLVVAVAEGVKALSLAEMIRAWCSRHDNKIVKFDGIELKGYSGKEVGPILHQIGELRETADQRKLEYDAGVAAIEIEMAKEGLPYHRPPELPSSAEE